MNPLFSVLIANYNTGCYLQEAIDSILEQTYPNWEVVIVDDGSKDQSESIYKRYKDDTRFHIYYNGQNRGCGFTKRRLAELAQGEILGFLDADDKLESNAIEVMVQEHISHPEVSIIFSRYNQCDDKWNIIWPNRLLQLNDGETYFSKGDYTPEHFVSFKKKYYNETEGINPYARLAEDRDLFFKMEEVGKLMIIDKFLYKYRVSFNSTSHQAQNKGLYWDAIVKFEACKRRGYDPMYWAFPEFDNYINKYVSIYHTKEYKIGHILLQPLVWCKRILGIKKNI